MGNAQSAQQPVTPTGGSAHEAPFGPGPTQSVFESEWAEIVGDHDSPWTELFREESGPTPDQTTVKQDLPRRPRRALLTPEYRDRVGSTHVGLLSNQIERLEPYPTTGRFFRGDGNPAPFELLTGVNGRAPATWDPSRSRSTAPSPSPCPYSGPPSVTETDDTGLRSVSPTPWEVKRNEARPNLPPQTMETATACLGNGNGALHGPALPIAKYEGSADAMFAPATTHDTFVPTAAYHTSPMAGPSDRKTSGGGGSGDGDSMLETPLRPTDHGIESNIRDTARYPDDYAEGEDDRFTFTDLYQQNSNFPATAAPRSPSAPSLSAPTTSIVDDEKAYCKIQFNDGYYLINTTHVMLVRDLQYQEWARKQKRWERKLRRLGKKPVDDNDDDASLNGDLADEDDDLVGRPAPAIHSHYSLDGGIVGLPDAEHVRPRRKKGQNNSSSNHSIAPRSLHDFERGEEMSDEPYNGNQYRHIDTSQWAQLPIHTSDPADIKKISREHLLFRFNSDTGCWVVDVVGNSVVINGERYGQGVKGIELEHESEIMISTVRMMFLLPPSGQDAGEMVVESVEDDDDDDEDAPLASRLANMQSISDEAGGDEGEEEEDDAVDVASDSPRQAKVKISLKTKRKDKATDKSKEKKKLPAKTSKGKGKMPAENGVPMQEKSTEEESKAEKAPGKTLKTETTGEHPSASSEPHAPKAPSAERQLDPNSAYANVAPDQLPEKRKGPGRPPKNGLISKRDDAAVKRKLREYQRMGQEPPAHNEILEMVRAEQRAKDAAAKAEKRGESAPDQAAPNHDVSAGQSQAAPGYSETPNLAQLQPPGEGSPEGVLFHRPSSPRPPRRNIKTPSPVPPLETLTEDQLKKPTATYLYLIHEVLNETSQLDLPAIYDRMQKKWPYFKYVCKGNGWQSSVRHNLLGNDHFIESGKSGKGKFWSINPEVELDSKKKKATPPPRPPMSNGLPYGSYPQQYGQQSYNGGAYGQQPVNGQMPYNQGYPHHQPPNAPHPYPNYPGQNQQHQQYQPPPPAAPAASAASNANGPPLALVQAIVHFRINYMAPFNGGPNYAAEDQRFNDIMVLCENIERGTKTLEEGYDQTSEPFRTVSAIFKQHWPASPAQQNSQANGAPSALAQASNDAAAASNQSTLQSVGQQTAQGDNVGATTSAPVAPAAEVMPAPAQAALPPAPPPMFSNLPPESGTPSMAHPAMAPQPPAMGQPDVQSAAQPAAQPAAALEQLFASQTVPTNVPEPSPQTNGVHPSNGVHHSPTVLPRASGAQENLPSVEATMPPRPSSAGTKRPAYDAPEESDAKRAKLSQGLETEQHQLE